MSDRSDKPEELNARTRSHYLKRHAAASTSQQRRSALTDALTRADVPQYPQSGTENVRAGSPTPLWLDAEDSFPNPGDDSPTELSGAAGQGSISPTTTSIAREVFAQTYSPNRTQIPDHGNRAARPDSPPAATSEAQEDLEDVDLRSPSDDPDYEFIDKAEATHSARNAQPDRKNKYPELEAEEERSSGELNRGEKEMAAKGKKKKSKRKRWLF